MVIIHTEHEDEALASIKEFLEAEEYKLTLATFKTECSKRGKAIIDLPSSKFGDPTPTETKAKLLSLFNSGNREPFLTLWDKTIPEHIRLHDPAAQKIEFFVQIFFAIFPFHPHVKSVSKSITSAQTRMDAFKCYLETRGADLCKTSQFLPYYALPYVPDPQVHPSFKEIFTDSWVNDVREKLSKFADEALRSRKAPRLVSLIAAAGLDGSHVKNQASLINLLQMQLEEAEERDATYAEMHMKSQTEYHALIGFVAELIQALTASLNGDRVSPDYLAGICQRLGSFKLGNKHMHERARGSNYETENYSSVPFFTFSQNEQNGRYSSEKEIPTRSIRERRPSKAIKHFDHVAIKRDLAQQPSKPEAILSQARLLQALRLNMMEIPKTALRRATLKSYITNDLLNMASGGKQSYVFMLTESQHPAIREQTARLLVAFAMECSGRDYLMLSKSDVVSVMVNTMVKETGDSQTRQHLLEGLQKLSVRRLAQSAMNTLRLVPYLLAVLEDFDSASENTVENAVALLMNLCLRSAGRRQCLADPARTMRILNDLIEHENIQVKTYVNGTLYTLLAVPAARDAAKAMGMGDMLKCLREVSDEQIVGQIDFVIEQLSSDVVEESSDTVSEDGEEDDYEEEDEGIEDPAPVEENEALASPEPEEAIGQKLLADRYSRKREREKVNELAEVAKKEPEDKRRTERRRNRQSNRDPEKIPLQRKKLEDHSDEESRAKDEEEDDHNNEAAPRNNAVIEPQVVKPPPPSQKVLKKIEEANAKEENNDHGPIQVEEFYSAFATRPKVSRTPISRSQSEEPGEFNFHSRKGTGNKDLLRNKS